MRRKDKEITDKSAIEAIINEAQVCRIGLSKDNTPYIIPMNFGYKDGCVYLHSAKEGMKLDILKENNQVCFEVESRFELVRGEEACNWGAKYMSVIGFGKASLIEDADEKRQALEMIMEKYSGKPSHEYSEQSLNRVTVIKIALHSVTGKKSGY